MMIMKVKTLGSQVHSLVEVLLKESEGKEGEEG
jgi:hypothetical protein